MSIRVTCPGCHTRFNVSEKFAGREGPCPKCKTVIRIPAASEEVQVHAPEDYGPKGVAGTAVLKPIFRRETRLSAVQFVLIFATITGFLVIAAVMRLGIGDSQLPSWLLVALAVVLGVPCVFAAYSFLRDSEREPMRGTDLWIRVACCAVIYGLLWSSFGIAEFAMDDDYGTATRVIAVTVMFVVGALTANLFLGFEFLTGVLHFGLFFGCCLLLRLVLGLTVLPGSIEPPDGTEVLARVLTSGGGPDCWTPYAEALAAIVFVSCHA